MMPFQVGSRFQDHGLRGLGVDRIIFHSSIHLDVRSP